MPLSETKKVSAITDLRFFIEVQLNLGKFLIKNVLLLFKWQNIYIYIKT